MRKVQSWSQHHKTVSSQRLYLLIFFVFIHLLRSQHSMAVLMLCFTFIVPRYEIWPTFKVKYFSAARSRVASRHRAAVTRRGKKSDDRVSERNHHLHVVTSDDQVEDIIFQHDERPHSTFNADPSHDKSFSKHKSKSKLNNKAPSTPGQRRGKKFNKHSSSSTVNKIHNTQGKQWFLEHLTLTKCHL